MAQALGPSELVSGITSRPRLRLPCPVGNAPTPLPPGFATPVLSNFALIFLEKPKATVRGVVAIRVPVVGHRRAKRVRV